MGWGLVPISVVGGDMEGHFGTLVLLAAGRGNPNGLVCDDVLLFWPIGYFAIFM